MMTILLYFFLFAALVLGGFMVGPLSVRVYFSVLFFLALLNFKTNALSFTVKNFLKIYVCFIVVTTLTLLLNGEIVESNFLKKFLAYYFPALLTIYGVGSYICDFSTVKRLLGLLCGIGIVTSIVTWLQYFGNSFGTTIGLMFINSEQAHNDILDSLDMVESGGAFGSGIAVGIMGLVFTNSYFISSVGAIPYLYKDYFKSSVYKFLIYALLLMMFFACFMTQERSSFFALLVIDFFLIGGFFSKAFSQKKIFLFIFLVLISFLFFDSFPSFDMGRLSEFSAEEDSRNAIWSDCLVFLSNHWLLGGPVSYDKFSHSVAPHNFFLTSLINSGLVGGLIAIYMYVKLSYSALRTIVKKHIRNETRIVACCLIISFLYSLVHNATFSEGDVLQTIFCILHLKTIEFENKFQLANRKYL